MMGSINGSRAGHRSTMRLLFLGRSRQFSFPLAQNRGIIHAVELASDIPQPNLKLD